MKIDFHTHVYPDRVALKTVSSVRERAGIDAYTDGTLEGLKRSMASAGIDLSVVAAVATKPEQVESIQRWLTAIRQPGIEALAATTGELVKRVKTRPGAWILCVSCEQGIVRNLTVPTRVSVGWRTTS